MSKLAEYLNKQMVGNVFDRPAILKPFATDQSILRMMPRLVTFPESAADVQGTLRFIHQLAERELNLSVTVRGPASTRLAQLSDRDSYSLPQSLTVLKKLILGAV